MPYEDEIMGLLFNDTNINNDEFNPRWTEYEDDIDGSVFALMYKSEIFLMLYVFLFYIIIFILNKIVKTENRFKRITLSLDGMIRYNFFIQIITEEYLEISLFNFISLTNVRN